MRYVCALVVLCPVRHLCESFLERIKDCDKFTNISNSVDTRNVCWLLGWAYFNDQSPNKTSKKPENYEFEI